MSAAPKIMGCTKVLSYVVLLSWRFILSRLEHIYRAPLLPLVPSNEDVQIDSRWPSMSGTHLRHEEVGVASGHF